MWGIKFWITLNDSFAPWGLPGRLIIRQLPSVPEIPRLSDDIGEILYVSRRISSESPIDFRSKIFSVASGVTSSFPKPVPPVVSIKFVNSDQLMRVNGIKFPNDVSNTQFYKQAGNSVTIQLIKKIADKIHGTFLI